MFYTQISSLSTKTKLENITTCSQYVCLFVTSITFVHSVTLKENNFTKSIFIYVFSNCAVYINILYFPKSPNDFDSSILLYSEHLSSAIFSIVLESFFQVFRLSLGPLLHHEKLNALIIYLIFTHIKILCVWLTNKE